MGRCPVKWSVKDDEKLMRMRDGGSQWVDVASALGKSDSRCRRRYKELKGSPPPAPPEAVEGMRESAFEARLNRLEKENAALRAKLEPRRLPVEQEHEAEIQDVGEYWRRCEEKAKADIARANTKGQFKVTLDSDVIGVSFISDQHIGPGTPVDFERMRLDAELIAATPGLYAILGGDLCDNHVKHRSAIMAARSQPSDQWRLAEYYLNILAEKIAVVVSGNHDDWTDEIAGISVLEMVCRAQRVCYAPDEAFIDLGCGDITYRLAMRHQFGLNSRFNQTHAVKQWQRLGDYQFDIGCVGHHHEACMEQGLYRAQPCIYIRPGSYQITSSYSRRFGYNRSIPTCPTVLLYPNERRMVGYWDVREAAEVLQLKRAA